MTSKGPPVDEAVELRNKAEQKALKTNSEMTQNEQAEMPTHDNITCTIWLRSAM